ncbi:MAG: DUF1326 domain-containing protein [Gemmatimonadota bacterium]
MADAGPTTDWSARGLLFENCNCTAVCPGHVHFSQPCTHEVCQGFWAIRFREGHVGDVRLDGLDAVVVYESPQVMIDGGWREALLVSDAATPAQRSAMESMLNGSLGGPWEVLGRFVKEWLPTRAVPIHIEDDAMAKRVRIPGLLQGAIEAIRGRDRVEPVTFENIYNQIHNPHQVIARGETQYDDGVIRIRTEGTHGLWSNFEWGP